MIAIETDILNLVAVSNQTTTYQIRAVFEGAGFKTRNLTITDPYGQDYLVCTTLQWDFKSSSNSVTLTVEAPKTDATVSEPASPEDDVTVTQTPETTTVNVPPPKTPEQIQQEAESSGFLKPPEARFNLFFPWFRLHFVGVYESQDIIDIGVSPIPFADYFHIPEISIWRKVSQWFGKMTFNIISGVAAIEAALWALSNLGPIAFLAALAGYYGYKFYSLFVLNWNSVEALWISIVSTIISIEISIWTGVSTFISFVLQAIIASAAAVRSLPYGFLCKLITIPINMALLFMTITRLASLSAI
jgi:hypothetical protein